MANRLSALLIGGIAAVVFGQIASAADLPVKAPVYKAPPPPPVYNWTGFYVGANAGWGWLRDNGNPYCINPSGELNGLGCRTTNVPGAQIDGDGFIGGGQVGYNWQVNQWVFGVETDIQGADIHGDVNIAGPFATVGGGGPGGDSFTASEKIRWLGTLRGRVGLASDRVLIYATGGFAYGGVNVAQNTIFPSTQYPSSASDTKTGWTVGGGFEYGFDRNWTGKIEGLYYDLGTISTAGIGVPIDDGYLGGKEFDVKGGIVRVGLNYKF